MAERPKKRRQPKIHQSRGTIVDVDPDKAGVYACYKKFIPIAVPDPLIIGEGEWKKEDRAYFQDHFGASYRTRVVTEEERKIPFEIAQRTGQPVEQPNNRNYPFFKYVLVFNINPGCRTKTSIDRLSRTPENVVTLSELQLMTFLPMAPMYQRVQEYAAHTFACWSKAMYLHAEESRAHEDNNSQG